MVVDVTSLKLDDAGKLALQGGTITGQALNHDNETAYYDNSCLEFSPVLFRSLDNLAAGVIDATGGTLILQTGTTIDNAGLLEATATGTLDVKDAEIDRKSVV